MWSLRTIVGIGLLESLSELQVRIIVTSPSEASAPVSRTTGDMIVHQEALLTVSPVLLKVTPPALLRDVPRFSSRGRTKKDPVRTQSVSL